MHSDRAVFSAANRLDSAVGIIQGIGFTTMDAETVLSLVGEIEFGVNGASGLEFAERVCAGLEYRTGTAIFLGIAHRSEIVCREGIYADFSGFGRIRKTAQFKGCLSIYHWCGEITVSAPATSGTGDCVAYAFLCSWGKAVLLIVHSQALAQVPEFDFYDCGADIGDFELPAASLSLEYVSAFYVHTSETEVPEMAGINFRKGQSLGVGHTTELEYQRLLAAGKIDREVLVEGYGGFVVAVGG